MTYTELLTDGAASPSAEEIGLWREVCRFWEERPGYWRGYELWFDHQWSYQLIRMQERERLSAVPRELRGTGAPQAQPENWPYLRVLTAMKTLLIDPEPWSQPSGEQLGQHMQLLFATRLATDPDLVWCDSQLDDGLEADRESTFIPRSLVARELLEHHRVEWTQRIRTALEQCQAGIPPDSACQCAAQTANGTATQQMWESTLSVLDLVRSAGGTILNEDVELFRRPLLYTLVADGLAYINAQPVESAEGAVFYLAPMKWSLRREGLSLSRSDTSAQETQGDDLGVAASGISGHKVVHDPDQDKNRPSWLLVKPQGEPLRGWGAIIKVLGGRKERSRCDSLREMNAASQGPIVWVKKRPEVDKGRLIAWAEGIEERARMIELSRTGAKAELDERGGLRAADLKFTLKKRPNAPGSM